MFRRVVLAATVVLMGSALEAAPGGVLGVLPLGDYVCELPGDALGPTGERQPESDFTITHASSYRTAAGAGTYLLTGDRLTFTSGPFYGVKYHRLSDGFLRRTETNGSDGPLRCVRRTANNR